MDALQVTFSPEERGVVFRRSLSFGLVISDLMAVSGQNVWLAGGAQTAEFISRDRVIEFFEQGLGFGQLPPNRNLVA